MNTTTAVLPFELRALSGASNYQGWIYRSIAPYLGNRILEIGSGIGNMSQWLPIRERLILTETDPQLVQILKTSFSEKVSAGKPVSVHQIDIIRDELEFVRQENLDTIISFNVLEHIEDDSVALTRLCDLLRNSKASGPKRLVSFVPAHQWAYGSLDRVFGHYRRYSSRALNRLHRRVAPEAKYSSRYFNGFGLVGWMINGQVLRQQEIGMGSIATFEKLCPILAPIDDFIHRRLRIPLGQSLISVWEWR